MKMGTELGIANEILSASNESFFKRAMKSKVTQLFLFIAIMYALANVDVKKIAGNLGFTKSPDACASENALEIGVNQNEFYVQLGQYVNKTKLDAQAYQQGLGKLVDLRRQINAVLPGSTLADEVNADLRDMPAQYVEKKTLARLVHYAADRDVFNAAGDRYLAEKFSENYHKENQAMEDK